MLFSLCVLIIMVVGDDIKAHNTLLTSVVLWFCQGVSKN